VTTLIVTTAADAGEPTDGADLHGIAVRFNSDGGRVEVGGLPASALAAVRDARLTATQWNQLLVVSVADDGAKSAPMLGAYAIDEGAIVFSPRFPLRPGLEYRAVFNPMAIPGNPFPDAARIETRFMLPKPLPQPAATVTGVFPSGDALPANLLKFYIHFSTAMNRGDSYRRVRVVDADGGDVPDAFLELGEELWDPAGARLTLLFDPGRIKRGVKPNEDIGAPLIEGRQYALVIDAGWPDAHGNPLAREFRKPFRVTTPDDVQPDPRRWRITPPAGGTRGPLSIEFDEPLDRALVERMLAVHDAHGQRIAGRIAVEAQETRWRFQPEQAWRPGRHELRINAALEDRAGNSVGRPFETRGQPPAASDDAVVLPFNIKTAPTQPASIEAGKPTAATAR
jgi:hypothetical protein